MVAGAHSRGCSPQGRQEAERDNKSPDVAHEDLDP
jgi:hypothetical protein